MAPFPTWRGVGRGLIKGCPPPLPRDVQRCRQIHIFWQLLSSIFQRDATSVSGKQPLKREPPRLLVDQTHVQEQTLESRNRGNIEATDSFAWVIGQANHPIAINQSGTVFNADSLRSCSPQRNIEICRTTMQTSPGNRAQTDTNDCTRVCTWRIISFARSTFCCVHGRMLPHRVFKCGVVQLRSPPV